MTVEPQTDERFAWIAAHGGPVVEWTGNGRHNVAGAGLHGWYSVDTSSAQLGIDKHVQEDYGRRMLRLSEAVGPGEPVYWNSTLNVEEGRYVRVGGRAGDFPTALAQVEGYTHVQREIGGLTWWREGEDRWVSWLGAFTLGANKFTADEQDRWGFEIRGNAPSLEEAALLAMLGRSGGPGAGGLGT